MILNLKRFVYLDGAIKIRDHVKFEDILEIDEGIISQKNIISRKYRLFSVVEHRGTKATSGHYVNYTLDAQNDWVLFDDNRYNQKDYRDLKKAQAYMLFYELIVD